MKIGIIDRVHHFYIYSLVSLYANGENEIVIFSNPKIHQRCLEDLGERPDIKYIPQSENEEWNDYLQKNVSVINEAGFKYFFILPMYEEYKNYYNFISRLKTFNILVVFNLNGWINPSLLKPRWFKNSWYKRKILNSVNWIAIDEHFHDHALKLGYKKNIVHIPSLLFAPDLYFHPKNTTGKVKFIFPGSIDERRRNYELVFEAVEKVLQKADNFELVLLGDPIGKYGTEMQVIAKSINEKYGKSIISYYEEEYSDAEYLKQILSGDIMVTNILPEFDLDGIIEIYGISKSTGSCFDILAYAIPGIFPSWISINSKFDSSTIRFENSGDLSEIMLDFMSDPEKIEDWRKRAYENSLYFSIDNVRERINKTLPV